MSKKPNKRRRLARGLAADDGSTYKSVASHARGAIGDLVPEIVNTAASIGNASEGRAVVGDFADSAFRSKFSVEVAKYEQRLAWVSAEREVTLKDLSIARALEADTPEELPTGRRSKDGENDENENIPWPEWQLRHRVEAAAIAVLLPAALFASAITAHANLVGTGLPVFLDNPMLPWTMAGLAPVAGLSVKTMSSGFRTARAESLFTRVLNGTALVFAVAWVLLFADQFHGLSASPVSGDLFAEPSLWRTISETAFVAATLLTEVSISAVLAHRLDRISRYYSLWNMVPNPESITLQRRIKTLIETASAQSEEIAELQGALKGLDETLNLQTKAACLAHDAQRARFDVATL